MPARHVPVMRALLALVPCALVVACHTPFADPDGDYLTDLADDGSLVAGLEATDPYVRRVAARGLSRLPGDGAGPRLVEALAVETDEAVLVELLFALGQWRYRPAVYQVADRTAHASPRVRAAAYEALGRLQDDVWTEAVVEGLDDEDPGVRGAAALALFQLDGRRATHPRRAAEDVLDARDEALWDLARADPDPGVRWRATYALGAVRGRRGHVDMLRDVLRTEHEEPLVTLFALRGLRRLATVEGLGAIPRAADHLDDPDERVAVEAARNVVARGEVRGILELTGEHASAHVRRLGVEGAGRLLAEGERPGADELLATLEAIALEDASPIVRREAAAALVLSGAPRERDWLEHLAGSQAWRDRERAARLLADGAAADDALLERLMLDVKPSVRAAALPALAHGGLDPQPWIELALHSDDPAVVVGAARLARDRVASGRREAWLLQVVASTLHRLEQGRGPRRIEAREALRAALDLDVSDPTPPAIEHEVPLLERLLVEHEAAADDPHPLVLLETTKGPLAIELDRLAAPRHVANFLDLLDDGTYDGLDFHRVVPDFLVQGLDPRGDGWGTAGRRVPDEPSRRRFATGTVGMANAGVPHSGGCQIFVTHLPTPHLEGDYTVFGEVVGGVDVVQHLEVGDVVTRAERLSRVELARRFGGARGEAAPGDAAPAPDDEPAPTIARTGIDIVPRARAEGAAVPVDQRPAAGTAETPAAP